MANDSNLSVLSPFFNWNCIALATVAIEQPFLVETYTDLQATVLRHGCTIAAQAICYKTAF